VDDLHRVFVPRVGTQMLALPQGGVLLNTTSGAVFELNTVATEVWRLLSQGRSVAEICDGIVLRYRADRSVVESDITALLKSLAQLELIVAPQSELGT